MKPLIDGDILLHEIGWSCEFKDKDTKEGILFDFDRAEEFLNEKIEFICEDVYATEPPVIYITNSEWVENLLHKRSKWVEQETPKYKPIFRYDIAKTKPYKGNRKNPKPFHFYNIIAYMLDNYKVVVSEDGLEADDMMAIDQNENTIICSRDKDLRICPGWHFFWECGKQPSLGPTKTNKYGWLEKIDDKIIGYGLCFFYYQMLVGDSADYIPGLPKWGSVKAFKLYHECLKNGDDFGEKVKQAYKDCEVLENPKEYFLEQANLLWIRQERNKGFVLN